MEAVGKERMGLSLDAEAAKCFPTSGFKLYCIKHVNLSFIPASESIGEFLTFLNILLTHEIAWRVRFVGSITLF